MTAPPKPWESAGVSRIQNSGLQQQQQIFSGGSPARQSAMVNGIQQQGYSSYGSTGTSGTALPRPPPRPSSSTVPRLGMRGYGTTAGYGGYGGGYSGLSSGYSPYGMRSGYGSSYGSPYSSMMGGMGSYGGYGGGYGGAYGGAYGQMGGYGQGGYNPNVESRFIQLAEENSRPAFESLESLVHAFGSVSMMLESTFFAIHSSFRAVLGVAENFGRMRGLLAQVFSALTLFRAVRWAAQRLLELLRLRKPGTAEQVWAEASGAELSASGLASVGGTEPGEPRASSAWPIVMFMSLVVGGPYLIWKLLKSVQASLGDTSAPAQDAGRHNQPWMSGRSPCYVAKAAFSFEARQEDELSFGVGEVLAMAPADQQPMRNQGWMLATRLRDANNVAVPKPSRVGLVPTNYFRTLYQKSGNQQTASTANAGQPVAPMPPPPNQDSFEGTFVPDPTEDVATVPPPTRISMPELVSQPIPSTSQPPVEQTVESGEELSGDEQKPPSPPSTQH